MSHRKIEFYKGPAGGWGALRSVAKQLVQHRVAAKGTRTLLSANPPTGFDCPGCAWPDRNDASSFEFCENGVKAVAAEITADRATPEVIGSRSVAEWSLRTDHVGPVFDFAPPRGEGFDTIGAIEAMRDGRASVFDDEASRTVERFLLVEYDIPRGCIASYYPETNALVPLSSHAEGARTPTSKSIPVRLKASATP